MALNFLYSSILHTFIDANLVHNFATLPYEEQHSFLGQILAPEFKTLPIEKWFPSILFQTSIQPILDAIIYFMGEDTS